MITTFKDDFSEYYELIVGGPDSTGAIALTIVDKRYDRRATFLCRAERAAEVAAALTNRAGQ